MSSPTGSGDGGGGGAQERQSRSGSSSSPAAGSGDERSASRPRSQASSGGGSGSARIQRGRGGFEPVELRTIPTNVTNVRAQGAGGQAIDVLANFVRLTPLPDTHVYQYRVDFEPQVESLKARDLLFRQIKEKYFEKKVMYDNHSDARSSVKLREETTEEELEHPLNVGELIKITIKNVGVVSGSFELIRLYNMHMKQFLRALGFYPVSTTGAYVHNDKEFRTRIGQSNDIFALRGYRTSANVHEENVILMNFESVHKIHQAKNVLQHMKDLRSTTNFREAIKSELIGKLVVTEHKKIVYKIEDVNFDMNAQSTFLDFKKQRAVSYLDYYQQRYNVTIRDKDQPLLLAIQNNRRKQPAEKKEQQECYLLPELCNIAGLTDQQRTDNRLKIDLIKSSQIEPRERVEHLREFLKRLHACEEISDKLEQWGYAYEKDLIKVKARIMDTEVIGLGRNALAGPGGWPKVEKDGSFDRAIMRETLAVAPNVPKLKIIIGRSDAGKEKHVLGTLKKGFDKVGLVPQDVEIVRMREGDSAHIFTQYIRKLDDDSSAAVVLLPFQNKEKYDAIKKCASVERGLITQVVTTKLITDERKASGASVKIAIQLAAKLGGEPWYINLPLPNAMVCGYDTYHDTAKRGRSFGAFVASMNSRYSKWFSKADMHESLNELSSHISENLITSLKKYRELNDNRVPDRVIIYRDGVGDGQLSHVAKVELQELTKVLKAFDERIKLAVIVVNKRVGARFYWQNGPNYLNCPPGTVIDDIVTRKERYDFYLVSQSTRFGTITPTYYNIIHDETKLDPAKHQAMAYKMCFAYYNWTGTVRVPAPCQYAHKLALLCGEHLHSVPNSQLDKNLHFL